MSALNFNKTLTKTDPRQHPVLVVGQLRHLSILKFEHVQCKLSPRVSEEIFQQAITCLHPSPTDCISLYLDLATIAALPIKCSRHNTSSRSHAITRLVKTHTMNVTETILIVCDKKDVFASACAVARAFPLYSRKSRSSKNDNGHGDQVIVNIEFILIENDTIVTGDSLSEADIECLSATCDGIRLAAKIVDMPCNEMNVSHFINEIKTIASNLSNVKLTIIRGEELNQKGIGGIYGVGKASTDPPALAVLSYEPNGATETYAWVGKGIVYDTGGLSIKQKNINARNET